MLIEFRISNHRSIKDEQVLAASASGRLQNDDDSRPRIVNGHDDPILPTLAIYGANASGKTNVLEALKFMSDAIVSSHRLWEPDSGVPREPFAWDDGKKNASTFEVEFVIHECRYQYGFSVDSKKVLEEWLYAFPLGHKRTWFEREGNIYEFGDSLKGQTKLIEEITGSNALYLSAASQHRHEQLFPIYSWFRSIDDFNFHFRRRRRRHTRPPRMHSILSQDKNELEENGRSTLSKFIQLLQVSDLGVQDVRREQTESDEFRRNTYFLKHRVEDDEPWIALDEESNGTRAMFRIGFPVLDALDHGSVLLVDELESSLHPLLAFELVKLFNSPKSNPNNAQLIFTTHDSNLLGTTLGEPLVRRDQVYLTEKRKNGATEIYPLTDYKPRKAENLERGYLQGRYGAIPFLGQFSKIGGDASGEAPKS